MIIHINGMPGVGKYTVAKVLAEALPARLIDNHLVIDLVVSICGRDSPQYIPTVNKINKVVHDVIVSKPKNETIIFTNALTQELSEDKERLKIIETLADKMEVPFVPILLYCEQEENTKRLTNSERKNKGKLMDENILKDLLKTYTITHDQDHSNSIEIDTSALTAKQTAKAVIAQLPPNY